MSTRTKPTDLAPIPPGGREEWDVRVRQGVRRKGLLPPLLVAAMLLPVLVVAGILWQTFSEQIEDSASKRVNTSISVLELAIERGVEDFRRSLARLATDNTLQVTVNLDIRPQLRRYLSGQYEISDYAYLEVANSKGVPLATLGNQDQARMGCSYREGGLEEQLVAAGEQLLLSRRIPLSGKQAPLGYLCAGYVLNSERMTRTVYDRLDGRVQLGLDGTIFPFGKKRIDLQSAKYDGQSFVVESEGIQYRGKTVHLSLGGRDVEVTVLVDMHQYQALLSRSLKITGLVSFAILIFGAIALRMLGQRQRAESELLIERKRAEVTLASIADGVMAMDAQGCITYANPAAQQILDAREEGLKGLLCKDVFELQSEETGERIRNFEQLMAVADQGPLALVIMTSQRRIAAHVSAARILQGEGAGGLVMTFRDMQKEHELRRRLAWKASRDDLTGLLNRSEFSRCVEEVIDAIHDDAAHHCLLYLDLDEFKVVNDTCGHKAGDDLLQKVSSDIRSQLRESDIIARLGGDEFGILLRDCRLEKGVEVAEGLIESLNGKRFSYNHKVFHVGASIGMVPVTRRTTNLEDLMASVDAACYVAKEKGRNRVYVGQVDDNKISYRMEELRQASHIRQALKEGRLILFRQPIVSIDDPGELLHSEVLVRMVSKDGTLIVPGAFIPIAERHGLMQDVDRWIIRHLFQIEGKALRKWQAVVHDGERLEDAFLYSINLSGASLVDPTFLDFITDLMREYDIPGHAIAFEITETQAITHLDKAVALIRSLKKLGCKFLLDDFGSGMSSFGYLKKLPIDYLKIDGQFVKDILSDPVDRAMVNMINEIGHTMGLTTVAEYVEDDAILAELKDMGVDMAQGYGISKPLPMENMPLPAISSTA